MREKLLRRVEGYRAQLRLFDDGNPIKSVIGDGLRRAVEALEKHDREQAHSERLAQISNPKGD
jgi:hypothetical protein